MDPLSAIIGGGFSLAGGLMGAGAQESANKTNQLVNIMNAMARERERIDQIEMAGKVRREDKQGGIDSQGNRTYFDPDRGWVVDQAVDQKEIQELQDKEQAKVLYQDLPMRRKQMQANYVDQLGDRENEKKYLDQMQYAKVDPESVRAMLFADAQKGIDGSFDEATSTALRGDLRQGGTNAANILSKMAREKAGATGDAFSKTGAQSVQMADSMSKSNMGQLQNLVNFFGGRARGLPAVNYAKDAGGEGNNILKSFLSGSQNSEGLVTTAAGKQGGTVDYITPNMGYANTMVNAGKSMQNIFDSFSKRQTAGNSI